MKKTLIIVTVICMVMLQISLASCGNSGGQKEQNQQTKSIVLPLANAYESDGEKTASQSEQEKTYYEEMIDKVISENSDSDEGKSELPETKEAALQRYDELTQELSSFDAEHSSENLTDEESSERNAITDEMLAIHAKYIQEPINPSDAELLEEYIGMKSLVLRELEGYQSQLENETYCEEHSELVKQLPDMIDKLICKYNYFIRMEEKYLAGENPRELLEQYDDFKQKIGVFDWKDALCTEIYWEEIWNGGKLIEK